MLSNNCEKLFEKCVWQSVELPYCDIFQFKPIFGGYCFSFNMRDEKNESSLRTSFGVGPGNGLKVYIRNMERNKFALVVHEPSTELDIEAIFLEAKRSIIVVNPVRFTSDPEIASLDPMFRRCYFTSEMKKKGITEGSCMRKFRLKYVRVKCNCTVATPTRSKSAFEARKHPTQLCNLANVGCLNNLEDFIEYYASRNHYEEALHIGGLNCSCYHNCDYIKYNAALYLDPWCDQENANSSEFQILYFISKRLSFPIAPYWSPLGWICLYELNRVCTLSVLAAIGSGELPIYIILSSALFIRYYTKILEYQQQLVWNVKALRTPVECCDCL